MIGKLSAGRVSAAFGGTAVAICLTSVALGDNYVTRSLIGPAFAATASNATAFIHHSILTVGDQQFVTYYNNYQHVTVARRSLGSDVWDVYPTPFTAFNIYDGHDVISFGIDGAGTMHISWGMHANPLLYAKSNAPVTGSGDITFTGPIPMTGFENAVTYPQFYELPDGDLLFLFREGTSGAGDTYWSRYDVTSGTWSPVHGSPGQTPFFKGTGWSPDYNLYNNHAALDSQGTLHLTWTIRYNGDSPAGFSGFQTNHNIFYARSFDQGSTWVRMDGMPYTLPISEFGENGDPGTTAEVVIPIPEGSSLINQCSMTTDSADRPVFAMYWAPQAASGDHARQYMIGWPEGDVWHTSQITNYETDYDPDGDGVNSPIPESQLGNYFMSRPAVLVDDEDRVVVIFSDYHRGQVVTAAWSEDRVHWDFVDLTSEDAGGWEPTVDMALWRREHKVHMLYHPTGRGYVQAAEVLQWDAAEFFDNPPPPPPVPKPGDILFVDTFASDTVGDPNAQSGFYAPAAYAEYGPGIDTARGLLRLNRWGAAGSSYILPTANFGTAAAADAGGYMVTLTGVDPVWDGDGSDSDWLGVSLLRPHTGAGSTPVVLDSPYGMLIRDNGGCQVFASARLVREGILDDSPPSTYTLRFVVEFLDSAGFGRARTSLYFGRTGQPLGPTPADVTMLENVGLATQYVAIEARNKLATVDDITVRMLVPGDANLDSRVDTLDTDVVLGGLGGAGARCDGDFTLDGRIDLADVSVVQQFFGFASGE